MAEKQPAMPTHLANLEIQPKKRDGIWPNTDFVLAMVRKTSAHRGKEPRCR
jgi:hypothetical protein